MPFRIALTAALAIAVSGCPSAPTPPPPPSTAPRVISLSTSASEVEAGATVTLSWQTQDAVSVELRDAHLGLVSGVEAATLSGQVEVTITAESLFVLTAANDRGVRDSAAVWVKLAAGAHDVSFLVAPDKIAAGESATLAWSAPGAKAVSLATSEGAPLDLGGQKQTGSLKITPTRTTTWILTVDGALHSATVEVAPVVNLFTATPASAEPGQPLTLAWQTHGAVKLSLLSAGGGELHREELASKVAEGAFTQTVPASIDPAAVLTYRLRAESGSGAVTERELSVYVAGSPQVLDFQTPRYAAEGLGFNATWATAGADQVEILRGNVVVFTSVSAAQAAMGSVQLPTPEAESTYHLRARHSRGGAVLSEAQVVAPVGVPTIASFDASPQPGVAQGGEPVTLSWSAPKARNAVLAVVGGAVLATYTDLAAEAGSFVAYPNQDTTYSLTVDNGIGNVVGPAQAQVTVAAPASLVFDPPTAPGGATVQLVGTNFGSGLGVTAQPMFNLAGSKFEDISGTGVDIAYPSNFSTTAYKHDLTEPFRTTLFGETVDASSVSITINGWFCFCTVATQGGTLPTATTRLPSTALVPWSFAPFWYNLRSTASTRIYHQVDGVAPNRRLILQWTNVRLDAEVNSDLTFQARIHEDGKVIFAYRDLVNLGLHEPSVGVVNGNETRFEVLARNVAGNESYTWNAGALSFPMGIVASGRPFEVTVEMGSGQELQVQDAMSIIPPDLFTITELNVAPLVAGGQWFELTNHSAAAQDLAGWTLDFGGGNTHLLTAPLILPAGGTLVLAQTAGAADGLAVDYVYGTSLSVPQGGTLSLTTVNHPYTQIRLPQASLPPGRTWQRSPPSPGLTVMAGVSQVECLAHPQSSYGSAGQRGTPGQPNTPCPNYDAPVLLAGNFEPIALTGLELIFANKDDDAAMIPLSVPVMLDGVAFHQLWVGVNGFISFNPNFACPQYCYSGNKPTLNPAAAPVGVMAPFWDDIDTTVAGGIFWERKVPGLAPDDGYYIVSWEGVHRFDDPTDVLNFQVKFFDTGSIEFHYGTMQASVMNSATTWFEHPSGTAAFIVNVNSAAPGITSNSGYRLGIQ